MFNIKPVFSSESVQEKFLTFLLDRVNNFAEAHAKDWTPEHLWTIKNFYDIVEEFSVSNIVIPFDHHQLLVVAKMLIENEPGSKLLKRYKPEEIVEVFAGVSAEGRNFKDYLSSLISSLQNWEDCPLGFSKLHNMDIVNFLIESFSKKNFSESPEDSDSDSTENLDVDKVPPLVPMAKKDFVFSIKEPKKPEKEPAKGSVLDFSVDPDPTPLPKKKTKEPKKPFETPKGPKLVAFIKRIIDMLEYKAESSQRQQIVALCRNLSGFSDPKNYVTRVIDIVKDVCVLDEDYNFEEIINDLAEEF
jgi:hypothetical protein